MNVHGRGFFQNLAVIAVIFVILEGITENVSAECNNYWLDQYEDVLPSINSRPEFPDSIVDAFQVIDY